MQEKNYPYVLEDLPEGGFLITFPDLPGCIADGATRDEAIREGIGAVRSWLATANEFGDPIPAPYAENNGAKLNRLPRSLQTHLTACAREEGVGVDTMLLTLIAEGLTRHELQGHST